MERRPRAPLRPGKATRRSGLSLILHSTRRDGFTHPMDGHWVMLPTEFDALLALEPKVVVQVVLEILRQTIGQQGKGRGGRRDWATISYRHFARAGLMSVSSAQRGIQEALEKGYIVRRSRGAQRFEYTLRWKGTK